MQENSHFPFFRNKREWPESVWVPWHTCAFVCSLHVGGFKVFTTLNGCHKIRMEHSIFYPHRTIYFPLDCRTQTHTLNTYSFQSQHCFGTLQWPSALSAYVRRQETTGDKIKTLCYCCCCCYTHRCIFTLTHRRTYLKKKRRTQHPEQRHEEKNKQGLPSD